jgi:hypothetical protein
MKLMVAYYSNAISAQSNGDLQDQELQHRAEKTAEVFLDSCTQEAMQIGFFNDGKI